MFTPAELVIPAGEAVSSPWAANRGTISSIAVPAGWLSSSIGVESSEDGARWSPLPALSGMPLLLPTVPAETLWLSPWQGPCGFMHVRLTARDQTSHQPVPQQTEQRLVVIFRH